MEGKEHFLVLFFFFFEVHFLIVICNQWPLRSRASYIPMSYLIEDILVSGEDRPSEEVLDDTEVQDLVPNGHANPWSWLEGRWHGQHQEQLAGLGSLTQHVCLSKSPRALLYRWPSVERKGFPGGSVGKESACNVADAGDSGSIARSGRSPRGGHGNPLQYSCLENPMDREAWGAQCMGLQRVQHN